jgi:hypothetical protein
MNVIAMRFVSEQFVPHSSSSTQADITSRAADFRSWDQADVV